MDRQKVLLLLLGVVALGIGGDWVYREWIETPFRQQELKRTKLGKEQEELKVRTFKARRLLRDLPLFEDRSLPADPELARQAYQAWWWAVLKDHPIESPSVDVSQPRPRSLSKSRSKNAAPEMHEFGVTLRGVAPLQVVIDLLNDFHQSPFLHRMDGVALTPLSQGQRLSFTLTVTAISLRTATLNDRLPGQSEPAPVLATTEGSPAQGGVMLADEASSPSELDAGSAVTQQANGSGSETVVGSSALNESATDRNDSGAGTTVADGSVTNTSEAIVETGQPASSGKSTNADNGPVQERPWQEIVKRNVFAAGGGMTVAKSLKLSAITADARGVKQAWFRSLNGGGTQIIDQGNQLNQGPLTATVAELEDDQAILVIEGDRVRLQVGQVIADGFAIVPRS